MARGIFSKVLWLGRATSAVVGLSVILALVLGVATAALGAAPASNFKLGQINTSNAVSTLVGTVAGPILRVDNNSSATNAAAIDLQVEPRQAPLTVNAEAGKAANLNAYKVDGQEASPFASQAALDSEANTRASADSTLQNNLDAESQARSAADNQLASEKRWAVILADGTTGGVPG